MGHRAVVFRHVGCSAIRCSIVLMSSSYIAVTVGIIEPLVLLCRDAGDEYYPDNRQRRACKGSVWVWLWLCGFDCYWIFDYLYPL